LLVWVIRRGIGGHLHGVFNRPLPIVVGTERLLGM